MTSPERRLTIGGFTIEQIRADLNLIRKLSEEEKLMLASRWEFDFEDVLDGADQRGIKMAREALCAFVSGLTRKDFLEVQNEWKRLEEASGIEWYVNAAWNLYVNYFAPTSDQNGDEV